ncbi:MAG: hypothetical protein V3U26_01880 [Dehalococcoidia bacterium]
MQFVRKYHRPQARSWRDVSQSAWIVRRQEVLRRDAKAELAPLLV